MKPTLYMNPEAEADVRRLRQAITEARALLGETAESLRAIFGEEVFRAETPVEVEAVMESIRVKPSDLVPMHPRDEDFS